MSAITETEQSENQRPGRFVGIRPRVKRTEEGEARPTQVTIIYTNGVVTRIELTTPQEELDFIRGKLAVGGKFRDAKDGEDLSRFLPHHIIRDDPEEAAKKGRALRSIRVPVEYTGLRAGDRVATSLGGLGDRISYAIWRHGSNGGGFAISRIPAHVLKAERGSAKEDGDSQLLAELLRDKSGIFRSMMERDAELVTLREATRLRRFLMKDRIAATLRLYSSTEGSIFCSPEGGYPEGTIEEAYDLAKASDPVLLALVAKEKRMKNQVEEACKVIPIYGVLSEIKGVKSGICSGIIGAVQDIGCFNAPAKFRKFCGVYVEADGTFPRNRRGQGASFNREARQAFYDLGEQFIYQKDTFWGQRMRENRAYYRVKHPFPVLVVGSSEAMAGDEIPLEPGRWSQNDKGVYAIRTADGSVECKGKRKYTDAHILRRAIWKTLAEFADWMWWKWRTLENYPASKPRVLPPEDAEPQSAENQPKSVAA